MTAIRTEQAHWGVIDDIMRQGLTSTFPAAVLLIQQNGKTLFHRAYGWLDPEEKQWPVERDVLFDLASLTKLFTATAFMTLVERGDVALETSVSAVLPEFTGIHPLQPGVDPHTKRLLPPDPAFAGKKVNVDLITFWHLLTHTSGLAAWDDLCRGAAGQNPPHHLPASTRRARLDALLRAPRLVYPPEERFLYSDLGFILLGEAVERLSGMRLADYLVRAVFAPLGMADITFNPLARDAPRQRMAPTEFCRWRGRRMWGEVHDENAFCLGGVAGHAGLFATAQDVVALGTCLLAGGNGVLSAETVTEMLRDQIHHGEERRGLGWQLKTDARPAPSFSIGSFGHTGFTGTSLWVDPRRALAVVLLTNRVYHGRDGEAIARFRVRLHNAVIAVADDLTERGP